MSHVKRTADDVDNDNRNGRGFVWVQPVEDIHRLATISVCRWDDPGVRLWEYRRFCVNTAKQAKVYPGGIWC